jgi:hypothetical protein
MRHLAHTLLALASLPRRVNRPVGTPELTAAGNGTAVIGSIRVIIIMATTIVTTGMGSPFSAASMMMDTILIITLTIATSGVACTHGMDGGGVGFMSAIIDPNNFGCPRLALSRHSLEASSMTKPFVLLLLAVPTLVAASAKVSWIDNLDVPSSGYCETAPPGLPLGHYFAKDVRACPENLKRSGKLHRQKPKRPPSQRPDRRGGIERNFPAGQG